MRYAYAQKMTKPEMNLKHIKNVLYVFACFRGPLLQLKDPFRMFVILTQLTGKIFPGDLMLTWTVCENPIAYLEKA